MKAPCSFATTEATRPKAQGHIPGRKSSETPPSWYRISHSLNTISIYFPNCFALYVYFNSFCYSLYRKLHSLVIRSSVRSTSRSAHDRFSLHLFEWLARLRACLSSFRALLLIVIRSISIWVFTSLGGNVLKAGHSHWSRNTCIQFYRKLSRIFSRTLYGHTRKMQTVHACFRQRILSWGIPVVLVLIKVRSRAVKHN
jgi:hypothetical protein